MTRRLVIKAQQGNEEAMNELLLDNEKIIYSIANKYDNKNPVLELSDLFQTGCMAFCNAVLKYDPSRGVKVSTFAYKIIENAIIDEIKKNSKQKNVTHKLVWQHRKDYGLSSNLNNCHDNINDTYSSPGTDCSPEELYFMQERDHQITKLIHTVLPKRELDMIIRNFGLEERDPQTKSEIAQIYNLTKARVSQIINNAIKVLHHTIESNPQSKIYILAR